jgi:hypothetical protein
MSEEYVTRDFCGLQHKKTDELIGQLISEVKTLGGKLEQIVLSAAVSAAAKEAASKARDRTWAVVGKVLLGVAGIAGTIFAGIEALK